MATQKKKKKGKLFCHLPVKQNEK